MLTVFISHASENRSAANGICTALENIGIGCWIAPRNIRWGQDYPTAIIEAIEACDAVLLVLSAAANASPRVAEEVERAVSKGKNVMVLRIEDVMPAASLELSVSRRQWLDGFEPPLEDQLERICEELRKALGVGTTAPPVWPPWSCRLERVLPDLEKMKAHRGLIKKLLVGSAVCSVAFTLVGALIVLGSLTQSPFVGIFLLLVGLGCLPPSGLAVAREQSCGLAVIQLSMALHLQDEAAARRAIDRLTCFKEIKELIRVQ